MANALRAILGETEETPQQDQVYELCCQVDDMTGEALAFACQALLEAGALDVWLTPVQMKKGRPGQLLSCLVRPGQEEAMAARILRHTTSLGVRAYPCRRYILGREQAAVDTPFGPVGKKVSAGHGIRREKYEYEDVARLAKEQGVSYGEMLARLP